MKTNISCTIMGNSFILSGIRYASSFTLSNYLNKSKRTADECMRPRRPFHQHERCVALNELHFGFGMALMRIMRLGNRANSISPARQSTSILLAAFPPSKMTQYLRSGHPLKKCCDSKSHLCCIRHPS